MEIWLWVSRAGTEVLASRGDPNLSSSRSKMWDKNFRTSEVKVAVMSNSLWPHGLQPTRLFSPWNSPARILEWVAIPFSRECSRPRDGTWVSHITGRFFTIWATREAHAAYGILIPWPGITPGPLKWKPLVLTPGPLGNSPMSRYCYLQISYLITLMYLLVYI